MDINLLKNLTRQLTVNITGLPAGYVAVGYINNTYMVCQTNGEHLTYTFPALTYEGSYEYQIGVIRNEQQVAVVARGTAIVHANALQGTELVSALEASMIWESFEPLDTVAVAGQDGSTTPEFLALAAQVNADAISAEQSAEDANTAWSQAQAAAEAAANSENNANQAANDAIAAAENAEGQAASATAQASAAATSATQAATSASQAAGAVSGLLGANNNWTGTNTFQAPVTLNNTSVLAPNASGGIHGVQTLTSELLDINNQWTHYIFDNSTTGFEYTTKTHALGVNSIANTGGKYMFESLMPAIVSAPFCSVFLQNRASNNTAQNFCWVVMATRAAALGSSTVSTYKIADVSTRIGVQLVNGVGTAKVWTTGDDLHTGGTVLGTFSYSASHGLLFCSDKAGKRLFVINTTTKQRWVFTSAVAFIHDFQGFVIAAGAPLGGLWATDFVHIRHSSANLSTWIP